jgi:Putative peptidoglycan binding domain
MDPQIPQGKNTGFIAVTPRTTDWVAGQETGISGVISNSTGDWTTYLPVGEWQKLMADNFETDACVSFSAVQTLATYLEFLIQNNSVSPDALAWLTSNGYIVEGKISFSPRFTARVSGTSEQGNNLPAVAQSTRTYGLVPDADWPWPTAEIEADSTNAWNIYYAEPPQAVLDKGKAFLQHFIPQYDWVISTGNSEGQQASIKENLTVAPLQIATEVCWPWNVATPISGCGPGSQHATELYNVEADGSYDILDHYVPFNKILAADYNISYAMRLVLAPIASVPTSFPAPEGFTYNFENQLDLDANGVEVTALQNALKIDGEFPLTVQSTGYFGGITKTALEAFQAKHGLDPVGRVGPETIEVLNQLFNK